MRFYLPFNEEKATQVAGALLNKAGGTMAYLKLIKLLYYVDREALLQWGRPVTTDSLVSMPHGPVVSRIYDLISVGPREDGQGSPSAWHRHITRSGQYDVTLSAATSDDELSIAENGVISQIWDRHGQKSKWMLRDETHDLPEWQDPNGSSIPIEYEDILRAENRSSDEIDAVHSELMNLARLQSI